MSKEEYIEKLYENQYYTIPLSLLEQFEKMIMEIEEEAEQDSYSMDYEMAVEDFEYVFNKYLGRKK